jgi:hypothetical protein
VIVSDIISPYMVAKPPVPPNRGLDNNPEELGHQIGGISPIHQEA